MTEHPTWRAKVGTPWLNRLISPDKPASRVSSFGNVETEDKYGGFRLVHDRYHEGVQHVQSRSPDTSPSEADRAVVDDEPMGPLQQAWRQRAQHPTS